MKVICKGADESCIGWCHHATPHEKIKECKSSKCGGLNVECVPFEEIEEKGQPK